MRVCHLATCHGDSGSFKECRERAAFHEAGHALLACLVAAATASPEPPRLDGVAFGFGPHGAEPSVPLPEDTGGSPWNDALVVLAGPAADSLVYAQPLTSDGDDWIRASRLLRQVRTSVTVTDAFEAARELLDDHRPVLEALASALVTRGVLVGLELWRLFQEHQMNELPRVGRQMTAGT